MILLAHRGFPTRNFTENSLPAFQHALDLGADGIEFDVRLTKDGEMVLVHDKNLNRIAAVATPVAEMTLAELQTTSLLHGAQILSLQDVTSQVHAPCVLDIEVKDVKVVPSLIKKLHTSAALRERTVVSSFQFQVLAAIRRECPDVRTLQLIARWPLPLRGAALWHRLKNVHVWGVALPLLSVTENRIEVLREHGFCVGAWDSRSTAREARKLAQFKLDVAIVKRVDVLRDILRERDAVPSA